MYTLRTVSNVETVNEALGETYIRIDRFYQKENFDKVYKQTFGKDHVADLDLESDDISKKIVSFIIGKEVHSVYSDQWSYIVGPTGDTFECVNNPNKVARMVK